MSCSPLGFVPFANDFLQRRAIGNNEKPYCKQCTQAVTSDNMSLACEAVAVDTEGTHFEQRIHHGGKFYFEQNLIVHASHVKVVVS